MRGRRRPSFLFLTRQDPVHSCAVQILVGAEGPREAWPFVLLTMPLYHLPRVRSHEFVCPTPELFSVGFPSRIDVEGGVVERIFDVILPAIRG